MKPEWVLVAVAGLVAVGQLVNVILTLRVKNSQLLLANQVTSMRQDVLDRVDEKLDEYKRKDVCKAEMDTLRMVRTGRAC